MRVSFDKNHFNTEWRPSSYRVFCYVTPSKKNHLTEPLVVVVGNAKTYKDAGRLIVDDIKSMQNTFGGLIEPVSANDRTYRIFKAEWKPADEDEENG